MINEQVEQLSGATDLTNYILSDLDCDGSEPTIADCKKGFWLDTECTRKDQEAGVTCLGEELILSTTTARPTTTTTLPPQICEAGNLRANFSPTLTDFCMDFNTLIDANY